MLYVNLEVCDEDLTYSERTRSSDYWRTSISWEEEERR